MIRVEPKPRPCILVSVGLPPGHGALRCRGKKEKKDFWEQHRGILAQEALCVLAVKGKAERFATIVRRDADELADYTMIGLSFEGVSLNEMADLLARCGSKSGAGSTALVQVSSGLFQYKPVLRCLQSMDTVPLVEELVMSQPSQPTTYLDLTRADAELTRFEYDHHQLAAMKLALRSRVAITQGPPGTGKTFMGVRLAEIIYKLTSERILCVCFTNHALDDFMGDLLSAGMTNMVRVGGASKDPRLEPYLLKSIVADDFKNKPDPRSGPERRRKWELNERSKALEGMIQGLSNRTQYTIGEKWWDTVGTFLWDWDRAAWAQLCLLPEDMKDDQGFEAVFSGGKLHPDALWKCWLKGQDPTAPRSKLGDQKRQQYLSERYHGSSSQHENLWALSKEQRCAKKEEWQYELFRDQREELAELMVEYDRVSLQLRDLRRVSDQIALARARIIGCTTTGAAMYKSMIEGAKPTVVIVEEAAEILEAHVLTSLQPNTKHLIMIGDHKQLRPKVDTYELSTACRTTTHNFNSSLFERLVLAESIEYSSLALQHRMHPEISKLIRPTYAELLDAPKTSRHPPVRGVKSRVVFIAHDKPEGSNAAWKVEALSKTNEHEVGMVHAIVRYLIQQKYDPTQLVVLTPYLGQLQLLRAAIAANWSVLVNDMDQNELNFALGNADRGTPSPDAPAVEPNAPIELEKKPVRVATIDNYQGEEADVPIISLVRSNAEGSIGFLYEPERVNVMLSRARHGMIILGNDQTLRHSKNQAGRALWSAKLDQMAQDQQLYDGFPAYCEMHGSPAAQKLSTPEAFTFAVPCGGCRLLCHAKLPCGHDCPLRCHPYDQAHLNVTCTALVYLTCDEGHLFQAVCGSPTDASACPICDELRQIDRQAAAQRKKLNEAEAARIADASKRKKKAEMRAADAQSKIDQMERERATALAALQSELAAERLKREQELREKAKPDEDAIAAMEARRAADEALAAQEEAALRDSQRNAEKLDRERQKLEAKSAKDLSALDTLLQSELQDLRNQRVRTETARKDQITAKSAASGVVRSSVEQLAELRAELNAAMSAQDRAMVVSALSKAPPGAMAQLVGTWTSNVEDEPVLRRSSRQAEKDLSPSCKRGLELLARKELLSAVKVFEAAALDGEPDAIESLLAALCKLQLGVADETTARARQAIEGAVEPRGLSLLVLACVHDADTKSADRASRRKHSMVIAGNALSFLTSSVATQLPSCVIIAFELLKRHNELFAPNVTPPDDPQAKAEAERRKLASKANTPATRKLWELTGILPVKKECLQIKDRVELSKKRGEDLKKTNYNTIFTGNPGTGKTTVARFYGELLAEVGALPAATFEETSGAKLLADGVGKLKELLKNLEKGGVLFVDEAYQLDPKKNQTGAAVLNLLLTEMENLRGTIVVVFAGYEKPMEDLLAFNEGLPSRFPFTFRFPDFSESELHAILTDTIAKHKPRFVIENPKHVRIAARRLAAQRGTNGFGNARAVRNLWEQVLRRQAARIIAEEEAGRVPDELMIKREDLLGPRDVEVATRDAIDELNSMRGLESVKQNVASLLQLIQTNAELEEQEKPLQQVALNRCFLGNPGTGKTTVARVYANILKALGLLSKGEVIVKNPSDFIGAALGQSDEKTKTILSSAQGSVLVIDEAYGLHAGEGVKDPFKDAVIDTIVAEVQGVPGDDRCVLLLGYSEQMETMMRDGNPGLARRFQLDNAFVFEDYSSEDLFHMMRAKAEKLGWKMSFEALQAGVAVLEKEKMKPNFGNGGAINNLLSQATTCYEQRLKREKRSAVERAADRTLMPEDFHPDGGAGAAESKLQKIDELFTDMIGCKSVLAQLAEIRNTITFAEKKGRDPRDDVPLSFVFAGPPGTGKTTVARRMGELYQLLDLLPSSEVVQTTAADLTTGYVGQARKQTRKIFESALGKVLFIDEAYGLNPKVGGQFVGEAVDEMVAILTDEKFKGRMLLILAGYDNDMEQMLLTNAGLKSRIPGKILFDAFDAPATVELLRLVLRKRGLPIDDSVTPTVLHDMAQELVDAPNFANGRDVNTWSDFIYRTAASLSAKSSDEGASTDIASLECLRTALDAFLATKPARASPSTPQATLSAPLPMATMAGPLLSPPLPSVSVAVPICEVVEEPMVEEDFEVVDAPDDGSIYTLLEEAASELGYTIYETRDMCAAAEFPEGILAHIKEKTRKASAEAIKAALTPQCPALLTKMNTMIREVETEQARIMAEEEARAEARRKKREQIIRCAACGSPTCSFAPRIVGYREVDE